MPFLAHLKLWTEIHAPIRYFFLVEDPYQEGTLFLQYLLVIADLFFYELFHIPRQYHQVFNSGCHWSLDVEGHSLRPPILVFIVHHLPPTNQWPKKAHKMGTWQIPAMAIPCNHLKCLPQNNILAASHPHRMLLWHYTPVLLEDSQGLSVLEGSCTS